MRTLQTFSIALALGFCATSARAQLADTNPLPAPAPAPAAAAPAEQSPQISPAATDVAPNAAKAADAEPKATADNDQSSNKWRYVRHQGRWWYWTPNNTWLIWSGDRWVTQQAFSARNMRQPNPGSYRTGYRGYDRYFVNPNYGPNYGPYYGNPYYGPGGAYYGNPYYGNGYGYGGYYNQGAAAGSAIGGALGGQSGANVGAAIGGAINSR